MTDIRTISTPSNMDLPSALALSKVDGKAKVNIMITNTVGAKYVSIIEEMYEEVQKMSHDQLSDVIFISMDLLLLTIVTSDIEDVSKLLIEKVEYRAAQGNADPIVVRFIKKFFSRIFQEILIDNITDSALTLLSSGIQQLTLAVGLLVGRQFARSRPSFITLVGILAAMYTRVVQPFQKLYELFSIVPGGEYIQSSLESLFIIYHRQSFQTALLMLACLIICIAFSKRQDEISDGILALYSIFKNSILIGHQMGEQYTIEQTNEHGQLFLQHLRNRQPLPALPPPLASPARPLPLPAPRRRASPPRRRPS